MLRNALTFFWPTAVMITLAGCGTNQANPNSGLQTSTVSTASTSSATGGSSGGAAAAQLPGTAGVGPLSANACVTPASPNDANAPNASGLPYSDNITVTFSTRTQGQAAFVNITTEENVMAANGLVNPYGEAIGGGNISGANDQNSLTFNSTVSTLYPQWAAEGSVGWHYKYLYSVARVWIDTNRNGNCDEPTYMHIMDLNQGPATDADAVYTTNSTIIDTSKMQVDPNGCVGYPGFFINYSDNIVLTDRAGNANQSVRMEAFVLNTFAGASSPEPTLQATPADGTAQLTWYSVARWPGYSPTPATYEAAIFAWVDTNGNGICDEPTFGHTFDLFNGAQGDPNVSYEPNQTVIDLGSMTTNPNGCSAFASGGLRTDDTFGITLFYAPIRHIWDYANGFVVTDLATAAVQTAATNVDLPAVRLQRGHSYQVSFDGHSPYTFNNVQGDVSIGL